MPQTQVPVHPKGANARVLLSSVFGPYAQDDQFGSRAINPMELYHNQVTRVQGPFSLRMFHRSWGIMMIQQNIQAPCTVLDFPTQEAFERELRENQYDIVGISSIIVNVRKVAEMCRIIRRISPNSEIVIGGHVTAIPFVERMIDADHFVRGEGISWMRRHLGENPDAPVEHPNIASAFGRRVLGLKIPNAVPTAATLIPSVGCPMGCNFCTTSSFFGGKGKYINFFNSGAELYEQMCRMEAVQKVTSFFVMDENFLLNKKRAVELLALMKRGGKAWELNVFSSANAIRQYTMEQLVELGVTWIWMGLESPKSTYSKLNGTDTLKLTAELRSHGIRVLGSTIVGLEHHTPENMSAEIEHAVSHDTDFHQFMLYTPVPGTPLYKQIESEGRLLPDVDLADIHGQWKFNFEHAAISREQSKTLLDGAFERDFERNGPSLYRIVRTALEGFKRYKNHPDSRIRERYAREGRTIRTLYSGMLWAMEHHYRKAANAPIANKIKALRNDIRKTCGLLAPLSSATLGPLFLATVRREARRLAEGCTYEPPTIIERAHWSEA